MRNKKELQKIWNQVPVDYYQKETKRNLLKRIWHAQKLKTFKKLVGNRRFKKILDVGCASGFMTNEISKVFPKATTIGFDAYKKAVLHAQKKYPHIEFLVADTHKLPFANNSFDLVICYEVIEHLLDPEGALLEIKRVLAKGGVAVVAMDSGNWLFRIVWWISENTICRVWQNAHLHPFKHRELESLIKRVGFVIVKKEFSHFSMEVSFLLKK